MNKLEMIKAFAELDGVKVEYPMFNDLPYYLHRDEHRVHLAPYNPVTNLDLTFKAMIKYGVSVEYGSHSYFIGIDGGFYSEVIGEDAIPDAVIECILKSRGLWRD